MPKHTQATSAPVNQQFCELQEISLYVVHYSVTNCTIGLQAHRFLCGALVLFVIFSSTFRVFAQEQTPTSIAFIGDTQRTLWMEFWREQNDSIRQPLLSSIASHSPTAVMHLGDAVAWGADADAWNYFDEISSPLRTKKIPLLLTMGNHEYMGDTTAMWQHVRMRFPIYKQCLWYSTTIGSTSLVVLNSNKEDMSELQWQTQLQWLHATLDSLDANPMVRAVVLCSHHPPYTASTLVHNDPKCIQVRDEFVPLYLTHRKTVLYISGHAHTYEHFKQSSNAGEKHFLVSGGGGGARQGRKAELCQLHDEVPHHVERTFHYVLVTEQPHSLQLTVRMWNSTERDFLPVDSWNINTSFFTSGTK